MQDDQFQSIDTVHQLPSILDKFPIDTFEIDDSEPEQFLNGDVSGHNQNLAEKLSPSVLDRIAGDLVPAIEDDLESRKEWETSLEDGLKQLGIQVEKREFPFPNACGTYSPIMMRTVLEYSAGAFPELLPIGGPVKQVIVGDVTEELEAQAERVENWANLYFTQIAKEFYPDHQKMYTWIGVFGCAFRKVYFDPLLGRPSSRFIRPQDFVVNYGVTDLNSCWRMTEVLTLDRKILIEKQKMGLYRDISIAPDELGDEISTSLQHTLDQVEGLSKPNYDTEIDYTFYECHTYLDINGIEQDPDIIGDQQNAKNIDLRPYVVTIHKKTNKVMAIYRNWAEEDKHYKREEVYVKYGYAEGLGFYNLGAAHLIGGLSQATTALLRQTIDGQTLSNFPGGLHIKGLRLEDNNIRVGPTEFVPVDTGGLPIQDSIMMMPYKEPSPAINEVRKELEASAAGIMGAANMQIADFNPNAPVGTTYALLGILHKQQGAVIRSNRDSLTEELKIFYKLFSKHLPETPYNYDRVGGSSFISRHDFNSSIAMVPVADPHVTTEMQRLMRYQMIIDDAAKFPGLINPYFAHRDKYRAMKMSQAEIDELMPPPEETKPLDPVTENQNLMTGKPVKASIDQDQDAHIVLHTIIIEDPMTPPEVKAEAMAHIQHHNALKFQIQMQGLLGNPMPEDPSEISMEVQNQIAMDLAQKVMAQKQEQEQQMPPPPLDPAVVMLEEVKVKDKGIDEKSRTDELKVEADAFKAQLNYEIELQKLQLEREKLGLEALDINENILAEESI